MSVKRYHDNPDNVSSRVSIVEDEMGGYVKYTDYGSLENELEEVKAERDTYKTANEFYADDDNWNEDGIVGYAYCIGEDHGHAKIDWRSDRGEVAKNAIKEINSSEPIICPRCTQEMEERECAEGCEDRACPLQEPI